jgi:hypothetical protein
MGIALICGIGSSGCRQRAFTELYAESLAREIREVEDLVYEFDAENRAMEYEIHDLRRTNAQLKARLEELQSERARLGAAGPNASGPVLERKPRTDDSPSIESKRNPSPKPSKGAAGPKRFLDVFGLLFQNVVRWWKPPFEGAVLKCDTRFLLISC